MPRDWLENPELFGRNIDARWAPSNSRAEDNERSAAWLQHQFACAVTEECGRNAISIASLEDASGLNQRHINHVLRGRRSISVATMIAISRAIGKVNLWPAPANLDDFDPGR